MCCRGFVKKGEECVSPAASSTSAARPGASTNESTTLNEPRATATSEASVTSQRTTSEVASTSAAVETTPSLVRDPPLPTQSTVEITTVTVAESPSGATSKEVSVSPQGTTSEVASTFAAVETAPPLAQDPPLPSRPAVEITTVTFAESPSGALSTSEVSVTFQRTTSEVTSASATIVTMPPLAPNPPLPTQSTVDIITVTFAESPSDKDTPQEPVNITPNTESPSSVSNYVPTEQLATVLAQTELSTASSSEAVETAETMTISGQTAGTESRDTFTRETQSVTIMTSDKTISENPASTPIEGISSVSNAAASEDTKPDIAVEITTETPLISENTVLQAGLNDSPSNSETGPVIEQTTSTSTVPTTAKALTVPNELDQESVNANIPINEETRAVETSTTEMTSAVEEVAKPISDDAITETSAGAGNGIGSVGGEPGDIQQVEDLPDETAGESKISSIIFEFVTRTVVGFSPSLSVNNDDAWRPHIFQQK